MFRLVGFAVRNPDVGLAVLACVICMLAIAVSVRLLIPGRFSLQGRGDIRDGAAIVAFAAGIWTTQFIGALAFSANMTVSIDVPLSVLSLFLMLLATGAAFAPGIYNDLTRPEIAIRGACLIVGVGMMHLVTMNAIIPDLSGQAGSAGLGLSRTVLALRVGASGVLMLTLAATVCIMDQYMMQRLAKEARRFRALADTTFEGLVFERDGRIAGVNRTMCQLAGSSAATLVGLRLIDLIPGMTMTLRPGEPPMEFALLLPDGQTRPVEVLWRDDPSGGTSVGGTSSGGNANSNGNRRGESNRGTPDPAGNRRGGSYRLGDRRGSGGHVVAIRDLSKQKSAEAQIRRLTGFDSLTGLANRQLFERQLRDALALADRDAGCIALHCISLNGFDVVNEALSACAAEQALIEAARRLTGAVRETDTVARVGHNEFAVIQTFQEQPADAGVLAERIVQLMAMPFSVDEQPVNLIASVGIALYPADGTKAAELVKQAASALRQARQDGTGRWRFFEVGMDLALRTRQSMERDLRIALAEGQLSLNYQPFVEMQTHSLAGYEALLRWDHPKRGQIAPADFIPMAETCGLIVPIGSWVLATACAEAASWKDPLTISVNLSPAQFVQPGIVAIVADVLRRTGLPAARLELEITEGTLMDDTKNALRTLTALKALGVKIAMDDFGTGYSSLSYLRKFPFDKIKIDRSFISDVEDDAEAETIVQAIIALSRKLRLSVTAEGVETQPQLKMLRAFGCTFAQGYLLGLPYPADQLGQRRAKHPRPTSQPMAQLAGPSLTRSIEMATHA